MSLSFEEASREFIDTVKNYKGTLDYNDGLIRFYAENLVTGYYDNGDIWKQKKVMCEITITDFNDRVSLNGHEASYEILGGFGTSYSKEELIKQLDKYNFEKKEYQYSIFDL